MSPNDVKMTPGVSATAMASSIRPIGMTQTGHPRAVHKLDAGGEDVLDAVPVDGVGVAPAHLHQLHVVVSGELGDLRHECARGSRVAVLVDEAHGRTPTRPPSR
jgi:hypothetical protein